MATRLIIHYLTIKQKLFAAYNTIAVYFFGVTHFRAISGRNNRNIIFKLFAYKFLTKFVNFFDYMRLCVIGIRNRISIDAEKVQITKLTYDGEKTIIIDKALLGDGGVITMDCVCEKLDEATPDGTMVSGLVNCELVNSEDNKVCLKELVVKYKDVDEKNHHTLGNIFVFNGIGCSDEAVIKLKMFKDRKMVTREFPLKDVHDKHINQLIK